MNATDRCDRCGAQALNSADKDGAGSGLLFCNSHAKAHHDALVGQGWTLTGHKVENHPEPVAQLVEQEAV